MDSTVQLMVARRACKGRLLRAAAGMPERVPVVIVRHAEGDNCRAVPRRRRAPG